MVTDEQYALASKRGEEIANGPKVLSARYDVRSRRIIFKLSTGYDISFPPRRVQVLEHASPEQMRSIEILGAGQDVYFPLIDEAIYLPSFLQGITGTKNWMASQFAAKGGAAKSEAKAAAARANGLKGGRPKKAQPKAENREFATS
jgi:hypothetical protein